MYDPKTTRELVVVDVDEIDPQKREKQMAGRKEMAG
jgi:hypothetical protein